MDPSSSPYVGELVGINAVRDGTILSGQEDVVLKIATSGETDLFVMFNRQIGANSGVPGDGDKVLVTSASSLGSTSSWEAALSSGETHTVSGWSDKGTLNIKVCSIDLSSPGKAHILVYANGQSTVTCDTPPEPTTAAPVQPPTASPIETPPPPPTDPPTIDTNCGSDEWRMAVVLTTDGWPLETSWVINDQAGKTIASKAIGSYVTRDTTHYDYACIDKSKCYTFTINDSWGDGLLDDAGYVVELYDKGGVPVTVVASGNDFGFIGKCHYTISGNHLHLHIY